MQRHRETVALWMLAILFAVACVGLGRWQLHRFQDKREKAQVVSRNYRTPPVPLDQLLPTATTPFDRTLQWRRVTVAGEYDVSGTTLVRNRPRGAGGQDPTYGYEVLVPLRLADGTTLLVDRGWLPNGTRGDQPGQAPDAVPAPPSGRVEVVARLRASEPERDQRLPRGQVASISLPQVERALGYPLRSAYAGLVSEAPVPDTAPTPLAPPELDGDEGVNASYAVQWGLFAVLALGFPAWVARRRRAAQREDAALEDAALEGTEPAPVDSGPTFDARTQPAGLARPARRRRIWDADAEDEDAMTD